MRGSRGIWSDCVAVFIKDSKYMSNYPNRMIRKINNFRNGYSSEATDILNYSRRMDDFGKFEPLVCTAIGIVRKLKNLFRVKS